MKLSFSNYKSVHPALGGDEYYSEEDETLEAGYDEEKGKFAWEFCLQRLQFYFS